jgi:Dr1-associated corepressor
MGHPSVDMNTRPSKGGRRGKRGSDYGEEDAEWQPDEKKVKMEGGGSGDEMTRPSWAEGVDVRTKFPVARIKRIMQADEDVGKVAQVTPVVVCESNPFTFSA